MLNFPLKSPTLDFSNVLSRQIENNLFCCTVKWSWSGALHLDEFVSAPQTVPQSPALGLLVVFVVLPESLSLLLFLLLLPQLLPRVFELSSQRRNHTVVSLLLLLVTKGESRW